MGQSAISPKAALALALLAGPLAFASPSLAAVAQSPVAAGKQSFNNVVSRFVLSPGDRGQDVRTLQIALDRAGYLPGPFDGVYGSQTEAAVREFQARNGFFVTGVADDRVLGGLGLVVDNTLPVPGQAPPPPTTTSAVPTAASPPPATTAQVGLRRGSRGDRVLELQRALNRNGARISEDGVYGAVTEQAVINYQRQRGLRADGIAGAETLNALGLSQTIGANRYLAAVPGTGNLRLARQAFGSGVYIEDTRQGDLVVLGAYSNRADAQRVVDEALNRGLSNARVIYRR
ncbi:MAG: peptidoglycan-binding protein [Cyanobacteria bacterium J06628_6]